jgi:hypothetical protein
MYCSLFYWKVAAASGIEKVAAFGKVDCPARYAFTFADSCSILVFESNNFCSSIKSHLWFSTCFSKLRIWDLSFGYNTIQWQQTINTLRETEKFDLSSWSFWSYRNPIWTHLQDSFFFLFVRYTGLMNMTLFYPAHSWDSGFPRADQVFCVPFWFPHVLSFIFMLNLIK